MFVWLPVQYAFDFFFMQMVDMFPSVLRNFILDPCWHLFWRCLRRNFEEIHLDTKHVNLTLDLVEFI